MSIVFLCKRPTQAQITPRRNILLGPILSLRARHENRLKIIKNNPLYADKNSSARTPLPPSTRLTNGKHPASPYLFLPIFTQNNLWPTQRASKQPLAGQPESFIINIKCYFLTLFTLLQRLFMKKLLLLFTLCIQASIIYSMATQDTVTADLYAQQALLRATKAQLLAATLTPEAADTLCDLEVMLCNLDVMLGDTQTLIEIAEQQDTDAAQKQARLNALRTAPATPAAQPAPKLPAQETTPLLKAPQAAPASDRLTRSAEAFAHNSTELRRQQSCCTIS